MLRRAPCPGVRTVRRVTMERVTTMPTLLSAADAATCRGVRPATLRVWRHRYGLTRWGTVEGNLYDLEELAAVLTRRVIRLRTSRRRSPSGPVRGCRRSESSPGYPPSPLRRS